MELELLSAATLTGLTPFDIIPNLFYPVLMGVSAILFIVFKKTKLIKQSTYDIIHGNNSVKKEKRGRRYEFVIQKHKKF